MSFGGCSEGEAAGVTRRNNSLEVPAGDPRGLPCVAAALVAAALGLGVAGCGGGDASGATVNVYVAAPLCSGAKSELSEHGATAGHYKVAIRCLASSENSGGGPELAALGSNSRRATEDTSSVAFLEPLGPGTKFSRPILETAGVPLLTSSSGQKGMKTILEAVEGAGSSTVRDSVREAFEKS